eukprot:symbB.v1.2.034838.t1/scaffold4568.1/size37887/4
MGLLSSSMTCSVGGVCGCTNDLEPPRTKPGTKVKEKYTPLIQWRTSGVCFIMRIHLQSLRTWTTPSSSKDAAFKNGGRWVIKLEKVKAQSLDDLWLSLNLALIGEAFYEHGPEVVCGAIVSVRNRASKIALWLSTAKDERRVMAIGREYRNVLASTPGLQELATKELTFEDFKKQSMTYILPKTPGEATPVPPPPAPTQAGQFQ